MRSYKDLAINSKLTLLVVLSGSVSLVLSCIAFVTNDVRMIRKSMIDEMTTLAQVLGSNSTAALSFDDAKTASELLTSLETQPDVELAVIYDASGRVFADFYRGDTRPPIPEQVPGPGYKVTTSGYLDVTRRIEHDGHAIGTIYLHSSMGKLYDQIFWYVNIVVVVMIGSLAASIAISSRLQRAISSPILRLADAAEQVSENNYDIRVKKIADDELGILYDQFNAMLEQIQQRDAAIQRANDELEAKVEIRTLELSNTNRELKHEITVRRQAEQELAATQQQLMTSARRAGMAEIATGVLHNVGNVLNSINVSATLAADRLRQSKVGDLARAVKLLDAHRDDLAAFMTADAKGKQLVPFLDLLATHLADERIDLLRELDQLGSKVDHIKAIVSTQQSYAGVSGVTETVDVATLLDDAMKLNSASLERHHIRIRRDYAALPLVRLDKQKTLQIVINLIKNAKDACAESEASDRQVIVRARLAEAGTLQIQVADNGIGIPRDLLTQIFSHGFTTKKAGHGFGLHSCANAAQELGGSLMAYSEGLGRGATFVLELPFEPAEVMA